jgi:transketolase
MGKNINIIEDWAQNIRKNIILLANGVGKKGVHIGSALSTVEILATIYASYLNYDVTDAESDKRDFFILSKGHAYLSLYCTLCKAGFFSEEELTANFMTDGGFLPVHPVMNVKKGIEYSGGSLGMGVSFAVGKAYALNRQNRNNKVYTLLGDGECNEGSVWEAFMSASNLKLSNLTFIIDRNGFQQDGGTDETLKIDLHKLIKDCGINVIEVDGHNIKELMDAFDCKFDNVRPKCIIANTVKGKGVSFMESNNYWHHSFMTKKQFAEASKELNINSDGIE